MGEDLVKVAETEDVQVSQMMAVEVNDEKICAMKPEPTYEVKVENNDILIKKQKENS